MSTSKTLTEDQPMEPVANKAISNVSHASPTIQYIAGPGGGGGDEPDFPDKPVEFLSPELAYQLGLSFDQQQQTLFRNAVQSGLPGADVRFATGKGQTRVGIWQQGTNNPETQKLRDKGVGKISLLSDTDLFGVHVGAFLFGRLVEDAWKKMPRNRKPDGSPSQNGPIHLTNLRLQLVSPDRIMLYIDGYDERTTPDTEFTLTNTNTLSVSKGLIQTSASNSVTHDDDAAWLTAFFAFVFPPLSMWTLLQLLEAGSSTASSGSTGNLSDLLRFFPREIPLPKASKLVFSYKTVQVSANGIRAVSDKMDIKPRKPSVSIQGQKAATVLSTDPDATFTLTAVPTDLLPRSSAPSFKVKWTAPGGGVQSPTSPKTKIVFEAVGPGTGTFKRQVNVEVTDAETTVSASTTLSITVKKLGKQLPNEEDVP